jgi:hypothetical protein
MGDEFHGAPERRENATHEEGLGGFTTDKVGLEAGNDFARALCTANGIHFNDGYLASTRQIWSNELFEERCEQPIQSNGYWVPRDQRGLYGLHVLITGTESMPNVEFTFEICEMTGKKRSRKRAGSNALSDVRKFDLGKRYLASIYAAGRSETTLFNSHCLSVVFMFEAAGAMSKDKSLPLVNEVVVGVFIDNNVRGRLLVRGRV